MHRVGPDAWHRACPPQGGAPPPAIASQRGGRAERARASQRHWRLTSGCGSPEKWQRQNSDRREKAAAAVLWPSVWRAGSSAVVHLDSRRGPPVRLDVNKSRKEGVRQARDEISCWAVVASYVDVHALCSCMRRRLACTLARLIRPARVASCAYRRRRGIRARAKGSGFCSCWGRARLFGPKHTLCIGKGSENA